MTVTAQNSWDFDPDRDFWAVFSSSQSHRARSTSRTVGVVEVDRARVCQTTFQPLLAPTGSRGLHGLANFAKVQLGRFPLIVCYLPVVVLLCTLTLVLAAAMDLSADDIDLSAVAAWSSTQPAAAPKLVKLVNDVQKEVDDEQYSSPAQARAPAQA